MKLKAGREVIDCIKLAYASDKPILLSGGHGTGKSSLMETAAKELGIGFLTLDLSLTENVDLQGVPSVIDGRTVYHPPALLPKEGRGILSLEELNRADRSVIAVSLCLLTLRRLNSYSLPPGFLPCATINPSGEYDVNELDAATLSRFIRIEVVPDAKAWLQYAQTAGVHPSIQRFVAQTSDVFAASDSNPRAWSYASDVLKTYEQQGGGNESLLTVTLAGLVGEALAVGFVQSYLRGEEPIAADGIIKDYNNHRATVRHWASTKRVDCLNGTLHGVMVSLQDTDVVARVTASADETQHLAVFCRDLPADMGKKLRKAAKEAGVAL